VAVGYRQKRWREAERLRVDVNATMAHMVAGGVEEAALTALAPRLADAHAALVRQRRAGLSPFAEPPLYSIVVPSICAFTSHGTTDPSGAVVSCGAICRNAPTSTGPRMRTTSRGGAPAADGWRPAMISTIVCIAWRASRSSRSFAVIVNLGTRIVVRGS